MIENKNYKWLIIVLIIIWFISSIWAFYIHNIQNKNTISHMIFNNQQIKWEKKWCIWWCMMKDKMSNMWLWGIFDNHTDWLPEAKSSEIVRLKDGDTYEMVAYPVKQEVGNRIVKRLSYNGMIPWPIIQVESGAKIKLRFINKLWVETTLHSHWLRLDDSKFDGLPTTMWWEQKPMKPWESFTYELNFPDTWVFWYHPHIREDYTQEMGLYGNFSVTEENYWNKVDKEEFMILDDFAKDDVFYKDKVDHVLMWRFSDIMMINNDENYKLKLETWKKVRLFITNVANTRTFDFKIVDDTWNNQKLKLVGWDIGRIEKEKIIENQIIAPAERYIVETVFNKPWTYIIKSKDRKLWEIIVSWNSTNVSLWKLRENPDDYKIIRDKFEEFLNKKSDKKITLTIWRKGMKWWIWMMWWIWDWDEIEWEDSMAMMNARSNDKMMEWKIIDNETWKENMDINWKFKKGQFVKVEIYNDPNFMHPMQYPIHFHWQRFIVLSRNWVASKDLQWKDTTLVKNWEKIEILIQMTNPWIWWQILEFGWVIVI